jgi:hypothetical protein
MQPNMSANDPRRTFLTATIWAQHRPYNPTPHQSKILVPGTCSLPSDGWGILLKRQAALQSSNRNELTRQGRAGILAVPDVFDATHRSCT